MKLPFCSESAPVGPMFTHRGPGAFFFVLWMLTCLISFLRNAEVT